MSQENVEIVREIYADPRGLIGTASERADPTWSSTSPTCTRTDGSYEGRGDARFRRPDRGAAIHIEPERFFDVDDDGSSRSFVRDGPGSGDAVEIDARSRFTIRDGLIVSFKAYRDRKEALEAAGLSE